MKKSKTVGRMFELTNKTFSHDFDYVIALAGIFIAIVTLLTLVAESLPDSDSVALPFLMIALLILAHVKLAVMIHRLIILEEKSLHHLFKWSKVELKFTAFTLVIAAVALGLIWMIFNAIGDSSSNYSEKSTVFLLFIVLFLLACVFSRIALIFPATAAGHKISFVNLWSMTSNNKSSMFVLVILVPYISGKIIDVIPDHTLFLALISSVVSIFVVIYEIGLISHCYDSLRTTENTEQQN